MKKPRKGVKKKLMTLNLAKSVLTSATLSDDVERLKKLVLNNPVILKLSEPDLPDSSQLTQVGTPEYK